MNYSYKDKVLISTPDVSGDIFSRSVVLIIDHNENGAFGLILNKKNDAVSKEMTRVFGIEVEVFEGGPVENNKIFFIIKGDPITNFYMDIHAGYYVTEDTQSVVSAVVEGKIAMDDMKIFSGYSGWASQQLEGEVQNKIWTVVEVYNLDYTLPNNQNLWKDIMQNLGGEFLLWANAPQDVHMN